MFKKIAFVVLSVFLLSSYPVFAQGDASSNVNIAIQRVETGSWTKPRHHMVNDWVERPEGAEDLSYIAVTYKITNNDETRKFDLEQNMNHRLRDEFGNDYRQMKKPEDYSRPVLQVSQNFPSLYPGEFFAETLFFEAPIAKAQDVRLFLDARSLGMKAPLELPLNQIATAEKLQCPVAKKVIKNDASPRVSPSDVKIEAPSNGFVVMPGQVVHLQVSSASVPDRIVVIAFDTTYEDKAPAVNNVYDINIPQGQRGGEYQVNVVAQWGDGSADNGVTSDTISLLVRDI